MLDPSHALALAGGAVALLVSVLLGIWLGFRICTRDAALLARFAQDARLARELAEVNAGAQRALREEWEAVSEQIERRRAQAAASASRAQRASANVHPQAEEAPPPNAAQLSPRERRKLVQRRLTGGVH
jgi:hypothetical protein